MKFLINGEFIDKSDHYDVINPYNGEIVDTVPKQQIMQGNH